jgi:hypothetical protein
MRCETEISGVFACKVCIVVSSSSISTRRAPAQLRLHLNHASIITFPGRP